MKKPKIPKVKRPKIKRPEPTLTKVTRPKPAKPDIGWRPHDRISASRGRSYDALREAGKPHQTVESIQSRTRRALRHKRKAIRERLRQRKLQVIEYDRDDDIIDAIDERTPKEVNNEQEAPE